MQKLCGIRKGKKIGSGVYGKVYISRDNPKLIIKEQKLSSFRRELIPALFLSKKNVIPKIKKVCATSNKGYIVQERYDGTLRDIIKKKVKGITGVTKDGDLTKASRQKLRAIIRKMHDVGVVHLNLHTDNIVFKKTPSGLKFRVIDPGMAVITNKSLRTTKNIKKEAEKYAKLLFRDRPNYVRRTVERELQFYKGTPIAKEDLSTKEQDLKIFKGI